MVRSWHGRSGGATLDAGVYGTIELARPGVPRLHEPGVTATLLEPE